MKTILILLFFLPFISFGQCFFTTPEGILSAEVYGDTVILKNDSVCRNCGSSYLMELSNLGNDTLVWMQTDIGGSANCICNFNLSVTIDSLYPGNYSAKVYYTLAYNGDTSYIGTVAFTITQPNTYLTPKIFNQYQSLCFEVNATHEIKYTDTFVKIFPNPSEGVFNILSELEGEKIISITDINNKSIVNFVSDKNENVIDLSNLPKSLYFITITTKEKSIHSKICKY